ATTETYTLSLHDALPILIAAGDFMQVQVGQRIKKRYTESPLSLYRALRSLNPSPYMYFYNFSGADADGSDFHVVGASPEILVRQDRKSTRLNSSHVKISY